MLCPAIDKSTSCEISAVIRFLHAKMVSATEIHHELRVVYGQNKMSEGIIRHYCTIFKDGRETNGHGKE
jgi:hypothetical protein